MPLQHIMGTFVTSGGELDLKHGQPLWTPGIGSPVSGQREAYPPVVMRRTLEDRTVG